MKTVWFVRWKQLLRSIQFWLSLVGYDRNDHSIAHRIYLLYAALFFSLWSFSLLALFSDFIAQFLTSIPGIQISDTALLINLLLFIVGIVYLVWQIGHSSPFRFTEEDFYLICQTPVNRSAVAISWLAADWLIAAPVVAAISIALSYALFQIGVSKVNLTDIPMYILLGFKAGLIIIPFQMGLQAIAAALGSWKLNRDKNRLYFKSLSWGIVALIIISVLIPGSQNGFPKLLSAPVFSILYGFPQFLIRAAILGKAWLLALTTSILFLILSISVLWVLAKNLNLSRSAQETVLKEKSPLPDKSTHPTVKQSSKRIGHTPSKMKSGYGASSLLWKGLTQATRSLKFFDFYHWLMIIAFSLAIAFSPSPGAQAVALFFAINASANLLVRRIRSDLETWWLFKAFPFKPQQILINDLFPSSALMLLCFLPATISMGLTKGWDVFLFSFLLCGSIIFTLPLIFTTNIIKKADSSRLLIGESPQVNETGILLAFLAAIAPLGIFYLLRGQPFTGFLGALIISTGIAYFAWNSAVDALKNL